MASSTPDSAPSQPHPDSDLDPAAFLKSVRELSEKREREDAERFRKLEEEVVKGRQERAARRAGESPQTDVNLWLLCCQLAELHPQHKLTHTRPERARSISPEKATSSQINKDYAASRPVPHADSVSTPPQLSPQLRPEALRNNGLSGSTDSQMDGTNDVKRPGNQGDGVPDFKGFGSVKPSSNANSPQPYHPPTSPSPSASHLARSGTLSWQQRRPPQSSTSSPASAQAAQQRPTFNSTPNKTAEPSREQIAASLSTRDPTWFKQTADRGAGSPAYRKSKDEMPSASNFVSGRRGMPGMSRESSTDPEVHSSPYASGSTRTGTTSGFGSVRESVASSDTQYSATSPESKPDLKALIAADEDQQRASPGFERTSTTNDDSSGLARSQSISRSQARLVGATDRPASPTKGMGGFVQSAMLKRSDSQSKRWNAQQSGNLSRQNSRAGLSGLQESQSMPRLEPSASGKQSDKETLSRLNSSSSNDLTRLPTRQAQPDNDGFVKPALPHHSRTKSNQNTGDEGGVPPSPGSPSKRWSPTKSSWIESALTRPESPRPLASKNSQPGWMADLAKANAKRASTEITPDTGTSGADEFDNSTVSARARPKPFGQDMLKRSDSRDLPVFSPTSPGAEMPPPLRLGSKKGEAEKSPALKPQHSGASGVGAQSNVQPQSRRSPGPEVKPLMVRQRTGPTSETPVPNRKPSNSELKAEAEVKPLKPSSQAATAKSKPEAPPKAVTDFRSNLRSRPPAETKSKDEPEFLSKFGNLRKTQQEKYVAPDVLKNNILRGKSELTVTGGPVKTARRDELKESLLAKKDDMKKAREEGRDLPGQTHEKKVGTPVTPAKPEALARREALSRSESAGVVASVNKPKQETPEALARHRSLKQQPDAESHVDRPPMPSSKESAFQPLGKQISAPGIIETPQKETSKLAARFNPGLASMLARGPPSSTPSRSESPAIGVAESVDEPRADGAQLQDVRKDRAKGPKRKKGSARNVTSESIPDSQETGGDLDAEKAIQMPRPLAPERSASSLAKDSSSTARASPQPSATDDYTPARMLKPQPVPGSVASVMKASLSKSTPNPYDGASPSPSSSARMPVTPVKSPALMAKSPAAPETPSATKGANTPAVPEFKGFGASKTRPTATSEDNKENSGDNPPSVKAAASTWGRKPSAAKSEAPSQIQLPTRKDEDAAMRSAGLLSSSPGKSGLGISIGEDQGAALTPPASAELPPKPAKSSRAVSGQLAEASPNKGPHAEPLTETGRLLAKTFGSLPKCSDPLAIDMQAVITSSQRNESNHTAGFVKTLRKTVQAVDKDGMTKSVSPQEEYTVFDESAYVCCHVYTSTKGTKSTQIFVWSSDATPEATREAAQVTSRRVAKENGSAPIHAVSKGQEPAIFIQALGGIFITRRGTRNTARKQYMLCGRKNMGHIVFDEVEFSVASLSHGFVYLISHPVSLRSTKFYLWKGSACSTEELSAARLAAMDISESGEVIEVDGGVEFSSFLKIFGPRIMKSHIAPPQGLWKQKTMAPNKFIVRLFRIQQLEPRTGFFSGFFRRPSWNSAPPSPNRSPSRTPDVVQVEAKEISPFITLLLEADGIYVLDAYVGLYILIGPLLSAQPDHLRDALLAQTLLFAADYAILSASMEDRPVVPKCEVVLSGVPADVKMLFRHWDEGRGLWGTAGLMAGSSPGFSRRGMRTLPLDDVLREVCRA